MYKDLSKRAHKLLTILGRSSVMTPSECWVWYGRVSRNGYGRVYWCGKERQAHRVVWEIVVGRAPRRGLVLDHLCRNRACVNPGHLEEVTVRVNTLRGDGPTARRARRK